MEVSIPAKLHTSLIGTKGRLVRAIMEECGGVHIHFPVEGSGSDTVVIRGPSSDVEKARKQLLHLAEEKVSPPRPLTEERSVLSPWQVGEQLHSRPLLRVSWHSGHAATPAPGRVAGSRPA